MVTLRGSDIGAGGIGSSVDSLTQVRVIGVGGGGSNAVNRMIEAGLPDIDFITVNTDAQSLVQSLAPTRLRIGDRLTRGLGVGGDHKLGMLAADESREEIRKSVEGADMLFITAGMGGGTGTGAAPVIAEVAKEMEILTVAVVTRPFAFEGRHRAQAADEGITRLTERADTIIVIPNERLLGMCDENVSIDDAFKLVDDVLLHSIQGISEVISTTGHINLDFNDVRATMTDAGQAWIAMGFAAGENRAVEAAKRAVTSPMFDFSMENAHRILFNIIGNGLTLTEVNAAAGVIRGVSDAGAQIIFGLASNPALDGTVKITLIATGFHENRPDQAGDSATEASDYSAPDSLDYGKRRSIFPWPK